MFKHAFHGGPAVEIFTIAGKDPLSQFKIEGGTKNITKVFQKEMKGSIYNIEGATTKLQIPASEKDGLGLLQPFLVFQINIPSGKNIHIEIAVTDADKVKRRLIFHSGAASKGIVTNPLHARIPIAQFKRDVWLNLSFDVFAFAHYCFKGINVKSIDLINFTSYCKLRKIFSMRSPVYDDDLEVNPALQDALNMLAQAEFGGDSSQILFENVPEKMDFVQGVQYQNQFIFPQRIAMCATGAAAPKSTGQNKAKPADAKTAPGNKKVAFGRVLPANAPDLNTQDRKSQMSKQSSRASQQQLKVQPSVPEEIQAFGIMSKNRGKSRERQVKFEDTLESECNPEASLDQPRGLDSERLRAEEAALGFSQTRENTFGASAESIPLNDPEEEKIQEEQREEENKQIAGGLPGALYDHDSREKYIQAKFDESSNPWDLKGRSGRLDDEIKPSPFEEYQVERESEDTSTKNSEFKIDPRKNVQSEYVNRTSNPNRKEIDINLDDDDNDHSQSTENVAASQRASDVSQDQYKNCFDSGVEGQKPPSKVVKGSLAQRAMERNAQHSSVTSMINVLAAKKQDSEPKSEANQNKVSNTQYEKAAETPDFEIIKSDNIDQSDRVSQFGGKTIENQFDQFIEKAEAHEYPPVINNASMGGSYIETQQNLMQNTNSDRFTSMKKKVPNIKTANKFSSSGIGNFPQANQMSLPPLSPTPMTAQKQQSFDKKGGPIDQSMAATTEMLDQTNDQFVEYDLKLNNQDQFQDSDNECSDIEENIVAESIQSNVNEEQKRTMENFRQKIQAKKEKLRNFQKITESVGQAETSQQPQTFGTQIVNYKPNFVEDSATSSERSRDKSRDKSQGRGTTSQGKRTFQGRNFAICNLQSNENAVQFKDEKENENSQNIQLRNKNNSSLFTNANNGGLKQISDPINLCGDDDESDNYSKQSHDQSDYSRLKSNRQHKAKARGFSPPIKVGDQNGISKDINETTEKKAAYNGLVFDHTIKVSSDFDKGAILQPELSSHNFEETHILDNDRKAATSLTQSMDVDETIIVGQPESFQVQKPDKPLMRVAKVDLLRDSLDGGLLSSQGFDTDLVSKVKKGLLPSETFCVVEETGELIDVQFDMEQSRCYINMATKEYYRPL